MNGLPDSSSDSPRLMTIPRVSAADAKTIIAEIGFSR
jgi:hypothetical protein